MASPMRSHIYGGKRGEYNSVAPLDPDQPVLVVEPLNSVPYVGSPTGSPDMASFPTEMETDATVSIAPAVLFMPSRPSEREWNNIVGAIKHGVGLTGSAAMGKVGPIMGIMDIGECEDSYLFRVSLPGVSKENQFSCDLDPHGKVLIKGITSTGEKIVHKNSQVFDMCTQNLCPPGRFSVSFQLPGPIDQQQFRGVFGVDGILEGVVKKQALTT